MTRTSFEAFANELRAQGFSEEKIRSLIKEMLDKGLCEGNDEIGSSLTEKGVDKFEANIYQKLGVV